MAAKRKADPDEIIHLQVKVGETVVYNDIAYGDRATLQVRRGDLDRVEGKFDEVKPTEVPDVAEIGGTAARAAKL
ncbi:MAG: hypothetical protein ACR2OC_11205 [Solirubrobacterales bacterium]